MIKVEDPVYSVRINGYYFYYTNNFISVFAEDILANKNAQCIYQSKVDCFSKKEFEIETIYVSARLNDL